VIVIGTRPIGQTVTRRARAAGLIVAEVERRAGPVDAPAVFARRDGYVTHERDEDPADWVKAPVPC
jgi:hypothetical protein